MAINKQQKMTGLAAVVGFILLVVIICSALIIWFNRLPITFTEDQLTVNYFKNEASFGEYTPVTIEDGENPAEDADGVYMILATEDSVEASLDQQAVAILGKNPDIFPEILSQVENQICAGASYDTGMVFNQEYLYGEECNGRSVYAYKNASGQWILFTTRSADNTLQNLIRAYKSGESTTPDSLSEDLSLLAL